MALTNEQKVACRYWLGYSGRFFQVDSALEQAMAAIDDADLEARIAAVLAELTTIDGRRATLRARAGLAQVDEVVFAQNKSALADLVAEGSMLVGRLAALFGVEVRRNPFSTSTARNGGGGYMRQG